jgi:hypothetical protein
MAAMKKEVAINCIALLNAVKMTGLNVKNLHKKNDGSAWRLI